MMRPAPSGLRGPIHAGARNARLAGEAAYGLTKRITIGLVVPFADDRVPAEGPVMYPGVTFVARGVGVRALTPEGYEPAMAAILPAAEHLARQGVDAIMVIGTSL